MTILFGDVHWQLHLHIALTLLFYLRYCAAAPQRNSQNIESELDHNAVTAVMKAVVAINVAVQLVILVAFPGKTMALGRNTADVD